jgi:hypothetical protein
MGRKRQASAREYENGPISVLQTLPDGLYPFIDKRLPLADLTMIEAPAALETLFKSQAAANGIDIIRDEPVELRCRSVEYPDATFLIYWPHGTDRIHMLAPREFASGQA